MGVRLARRIQSLKRPRIGGASIKRRRPKTPLGIGTSSLRIRSEHAADRTSSLVGELLKTPRRAGDIDEIVNPCFYQNSHRVSLHGPAQPFSGEPRAERKEMITLNHLPLL